MYDNALIGRLALIRAYRTRPEPLCQRCGAYQDGTAPTVHFPVCAEVGLTCRDVCHNYRFSYDICPTCTVILSEEIAW